MYSIFIYVASQAELIFPKELAQKHIVQFVIFLCQLLHRIFLI